MARVRGSTPKMVFASVDGCHTEHRPRTDVRPAENLVQMKIGPLSHLFWDSGQLGAGSFLGVGALLLYWAKTG
jgi:hypothetical protein